ncbi:hypothetical protein ABK040_008242 [Willaertia magna]
MVEKILKAIIIGDSLVGKSQLMLWIVGERKDTKPTIGVEMKIRSVNINGKIFKITIYDTAGSERFKSITCGYYRNSQIVFLVYDVTDRSSFDNIKGWLEDYKTHAFDEECYITLIGNKIDLEDKRVVSYEEGQKLAKELEIPSFYETSVMSNVGIEEAFIGGVKNYVDKCLRVSTHERSVSLDPSSGETDNNYKKCC